MHIQYTYNHGGAIMKDNNFVNLGKRIREKRLSQNLTQEALAEKADVGTTHISHIETGCTKLSGVLPVKRTIKNNKFCIVSQVLAGDIFRLLLYIDYDIPLVSSHLTSFAIFDYCSN